MRFARPPHANAVATTAATAVAPRIDLNLVDKHRAAYIKASE
jgi:hypothetical protein